MKTHSFTVNNIKYENTEDFLKNGRYVINSNVFDEFYIERISSENQGIYYITSILESGKKIEHKFIFIDKYYEKMILKPLMIPENNMFNTKHKIIKKEFDYTSYNITNYHTRRNEIIDFNGTIRKKEKTEEKIEYYYRNFLIKPREGYSLKEYFKSEKIFKLEDYPPKIRKNILNNQYQGLYVTRLILNTGEHINLYYTYAYHKNNEIYTKPLNKYLHERNEQTIPSEYIADKQITYYSYSTRITGDNNTWMNLQKYHKHTYEKYSDNDYISVPLSNLSEEIYTKIKKFGDKLQVIYTFNCNDKTIIEEYKYVKIKKNFEHNEKFVILKTTNLPKDNWNTTELEDITNEKWVCKIIN